MDRLCASCRAERSTVRTLLRSGEKNTSVNTSMLNVGSALCL